jgi:hypothetical protein
MMTFLKLLKIEQCPMALIVLSFSPCTYEAVSEVVVRYVTTPLRRNYTVYKTPNEIVNGRALKLPSEIQHESEIVSSLSGYDEPDTSIFLVQEGTSAEIAFHDHCELNFGLFVSFWNVEESEVRVFEGPWRPGGPNTVSLVETDDLCGEIDAYVERYLDERHVANQ